MKKYIFLVIGLFIFNLQTIGAVNTVAAAPKADKATLKKAKKQAKLWKKITTKAAKYKAKVVEKVQAQEFFGGVTDESKFRLGLLLFVAGVLIRWLLNGLLGWIGALIAVGGVVLMVLALLDYI